MTQAEYVRELKKTCERLGYLVLSMVNDHPSLYAEYETELQEMKRQIAFLAEVSNQIKTIS